MYFAEYGETEVLAVARHFQQKLKSAAKNVSTEEALSELRVMQKVEISSFSSI